MFDKRRKRYLGYHVLMAAEKRIALIFDSFSRIYLSFSGGKDSTVMFHLCAEEARRRGRKFGLLFIDWECQYQLTIDHITEMVNMYSDCIELYWCCIPMKTVNAVSVFEPEWVAWDPDKEWIRDKPEIAIKDSSFFPFYQSLMTFEEFVCEFARWYAGDELTACLVGIRSDESLYRWMTLKANKEKKMFMDQHWTTGIGPNIYNAYPIYDWKVNDIWTYCGRFGKCYNPLYDRFYQAGISLAKMRICEPFGNEQRQALNLFQVIEPQTWSRMVARVNGANFGATYARERGIVLGNYHINKPEQHSWESFTKLLLDSMPQKTAEHYRNKIAVYMRWWMTKGGLEGVFPDEQYKDTGARDVPSWRRICKCVVKNDYWCKTLCFAPTKTDAYDRYCELMKQRRDEWKLI